MNRIPRKLRRPFSNRRRTLARAISHCVLAGSAALLVPKEAAQAAMIWDGGGTTDLWSDVLNWDNDAFPGYGTLTFAGSLRTTNIVDASISQNMLLWTGTSPWTLNSANGAVISLFDNGGVQAKLENQSTGLVTINAPVTFAATAGAAWGEINAVNGGITFGSAGTLTVDGSAVAGIRMFGAGQTTTFNNTVSATGKYFATTAATAGTVEIGGAFTSGDFYLMNGSTLKLNTGGSLTTSALRLGGDFATTGAQNLTLGATFQLTDLAGGQTFSSIINSVTSNTSGALLIDALNTSGTDTLSGNIFLDSPLRIQVAAGGTVAATGVISNASSLTKQGDGTLTLSNTNTYTGGTTLSAGTLNINSAAAIGNTATGALTVTGGTINNTSGGAITTTTAKAISLNGDLIFTGTQNLNFNGGTITAGGAAGTRTLTTSAGTLTALRIVTNAGVNFSKAGAGTLSLSSTANNDTTLAGNLDINAGKILFNADATVGGLSGSGGSIEMGTAVLKWFFLNSVGSQSWGGNLLGGAGTWGLTKDGTGAQAFTGNLTIGSDFRHIRGNMTLSGTNSMTGVFSVGLATAYTDATLPTLTISGGTTTVPNQIVQVGTIANGNAVLVVNGGTLNATKASSPSLRAGVVANGRGFINMTSGAINTTSELHLGNFGGSYGALTMSGGALTSGSWLVVAGSGDRAVLNQSGGTITVSTNRLTIGTGNNASLGVVNASGGTLTATGSINVGESGTGILNVSGTALVTTGAAGTVQFGGNAAQLAGTINLLGGTLSTNSIVKGTSTATAVELVNFNGGTLKATATNAAFFANLALTTAYVYGGNGTIDNGGFAVAVAEPLLAPTGNGVNGITSFTGGAGYIDQPVVTVVRGAGDTTGVGATVVANVSGGVVTGITITNPGVGYTVAPTFTITGGGATTAATITGAAPTANTSGGMIFQGAGGTTTLSTGASSFTGNVTINSGAVTVSAQALGTGLTSGLGNLTTAGKTITVNTGGTLNLTINNTLDNGTLPTAALVISGGTVNSTRFNGVGNVTLSNGGTLANAATDTGNFQGYNLRGAVTVAAGGTVASTISTSVASATQGGNHLDGIVTFTVADVTGDTNADLIVSAPLRDKANAGGAGGLIKAGAGTISLTGTNTYTGATTVNAGALLLSGSGAINATSGVTLNGSGTKLVQTSSVAISPTVTVTNGTVDGTTTINTVNVADLAANTITHGNGTAGSQLTIGALTFSGAGKFSLILNGTSAGVVTTTLAANGAASSVLIDASNIAWDNGTTYPLVSYGGGTIGGTGGFGAFIKGAITGLGARQSAMLGDSGTAITLAIAGDLPVWTGLQSGAWTTATIGGLSNWRLQTALTDTDFLVGDTALFTDTIPGGGAPGTTMVDIVQAGGVAPTTTTFNNSSLAYTISASGGSGITSGTFIKNGTAALNLGGTHSYTSATLLNAGTTNLTGTLGNTAVTVGSTATLSLQAAGAISQNTVTVNGTFAETVDNALSGTAALVLNNGATLDRANAHSGGTAITAGTLNLSHAAALGSGTFAITGGTLDNTSGGALTLSTNNAQTWNGSFAFTGTNALNLGTGAVSLGLTPGAQTITLTNSGALTVGGAITGGSAGAKELIIAGAGSTALTGNFGVGTATSLVLTSTSTTLTLGGTGTLTTLNMNGGASSIVDIGAGALTVSNGGGSVLQSTTGGTINGTGTLTVSNGGDFGTMGGTTLTVNAKLTGANGVDFWNNNGGAGLGTVVLAGANTYTGATSVQNEKVVIPAGGAINALNTANNGQITVGNNGGLSAVLSVEGGTINARKNTSPSISVGSATNAVGVINLTSGAINTTSEFHLGGNAGGYAALTMSGGALTSGSWLVVGFNNDRAVLNQSGGSITVGANRMTIGAGGAGSIGEVNLSGGTFTSNGGIYIGENGTGTLTISGGAAVTASNVQFNNGATSLAGNLTLNGGTLNAATITKGVGTGVYRLNFNGGTLKATAAGTLMESLANTTAYVNGGGAVIDDGGFAVTFAQPLLAPTGDGISGFNVTGGAGYLAPPVVQITGDGTGASAVANIDGSGNITGITITNPGVNYTTATATLLGGGGTGATVDPATFATNNTSGGLTKNGAGTLTLSGANTFTGTTTVNAGTLALGSAGAIGGGGNVTFGGGTLQFSATNTSDLGARIVNSASAIKLDTNGQNVTFAGALAASNSGGLVKLGAGTLTLSSAAAYTGATDLNAGNLSGTGFAGAVTIAAGSTLFFPATGSIGGLLTLSGTGSMVNLQNSALNVVTLGAGLTLNTGNMLDFDIGAGADRFAISAGAFGATGITTLNFADIGVAAGTYNLITGATGISLSNFVSSVATLGGMNLTLGVSGGNTLTLTLSAPGPATAFWKGDQDAFWNTMNAGNSNFDTTQSGGVDTGALPDATSDVIFAADGATNLDTTLGADQSVKSLTIATASAVGIGGANTLTFASSGGITMNSGAGALTISASAVTLGASQAWTNNSSNPVTVSSAINGNAAPAATRTLTFAGSGAGAINITGAIGDGAIGGNVAILVNKSGGSVTFSAQNTFTGGTTVTAGTLVLGHATNTLADAGAVTVNGGTLDIGANSDTVGAITLNSGSITGTTGVLTGSSYAVESGSISAILGGAAALTKTTAGTVILSADNTYSGGTTISAGTLQIGNGTSSTGAIGSGPVTNNSALAFNRAGTLTVGNTISGTGTLTQNGPGAVTLTATNTYTGDTTLNGGTLNINSAGAIGNTAAGALVITGGTLDNTSGGALTTTAAKAINLNADLTFTGTNDLNMNGGTLAAGGAAGTRTLTVSAGTLSVNNITTAGGVSFSKAGAGTLSLTGGGTNLAGVLDIQAGRIVVVQDMTVGSLSGAGNIEHGGGGNKWLFANGAMDSSYSGAIKNFSGTVRLGFVKSGSGTLTMSGASDTNLDRLGIERGVMALTAGSIGSVGALTIGNGAANPAAVRVSGGALVSGGETQIGNNSGGYGALSVSGGTFTSASWMVVGGNNDRAVLNQSGGTINVNSNRMTIGAGNAGSIAVANLSGGTFNDAGGIFVGENGQGTLNVSGTALMNLGAGTLQFANTGTSTVGNVNLLGGTIQTGAVTKGASNATGVYRFNFNGGTLRAGANSATFFAALPLTTAYVFGGGATFDSNGFDVTVAQPLLAPTGSGVSSIAVTDGGAGYIDQPVVTLSGGSGTGATAIANVSGGVVTGFTITNPGVDYLATDTLTVTLAGGGATTAATVGTASFATNTTGALTKNGAGTLTLSGANTYTGTTINAGTLAAGNDAAVGSGLVTLNGGALGASGARTLTNTVQVNAVAGNGLDATTGNDLTLNGSLTGSGTVTKTGDGSLFLSGNNSGFTGTVSTSAGFTRITAINAASASATWDVGAGGTLASDIAGSNTIALGALSGSGVVGNNTGIGSLTFSIGGNNADTTFSGVIKDDVFDFPSDPVNVTKVGTGTTTFSGVNTYAGPTAINGGTLSISASENLGNASATNTLSLAGGTLESTGASVDLGSTRAIALGVGGGTFRVTGANLLTVSGAINGTAGLVKSGTGTLAVTTDNSATFSGPTTISAGTFMASNFTGSATGTGDVTVESGATLGGTGRLTGNVIVNADGILSPGASIGTLFTGPLMLNGGSDFQLELNTTSQLADLVRVSAATAADGDLTLSGTVSLLVSDANPGALGLHDHLTFMTYSGDRLGAGFFRVPGFDFDLTDYTGNDATAAYFTLNGTPFAIDYNYNDAAFAGVTSVALVVVPEPNSIAALFVGLGGLLGLQRFRRRNAR